MNINFISYLLAIQHIVLESKKQIINFIKEDTFIYTAN